MTVYAPSDFTEVTIPAEGGRGCGLTHRRDIGPDGRPVHPFGITCAPCEAYLRATDDRWSTTVEDIRETFDEAKARERYELRGAQARDALMLAAVAQLAGFSPGQIPAVIQRQIAGLKPHVPLAGQLECPDGHVQPAGQRYCGECGQPMSAKVPVGSLTPGATA